jgi:hypothetical protein
LHFTLNLMKYLIVFLVFSQTSVFAQSYEQQINAYLNEYKRDFIENPHSPLKENDIKDLHFYKADSTFRLNARVELLPQEKPVKMPTSGGDTKQFYRYAKLYFYYQWKGFPAYLV